MRMLLACLSLSLSLTLSIGCQTQLVREAEDGHLTSIDKAPIWNAKNTIKFKQRLFLNVRGREFELVAIMMIHPNHDFVAQAYAEGPTPIFSFKSESGSVTVDHVPEPIGSNLIANVVIPDLRLAFLLTGKGESPIFFQHNNLLAKALRKNKNGDLVMKVTWTDMASIEGQPYAKFIQVENHEYPYQLRIENLSADLQPE